MSGAPRSFFNAIDAANATVRQVRDAPRHLPTSTELGIEAELWNALSRRVSERTDRKALFSSRDRAVRIAVMALDAATDEWRAGYEARISASEVGEKSRPPDGDYAGETP